MDINSDSSEKSQEQTLEMPKENFNNKVYLGNREIEFRKWKVKDKFAVINAKTDHQLKQALVYNCLKDKSICLDKNEFEYMLLQIRQASMSQKYKLEIECSECGKKFDYTFNAIEKQNIIIGRNFNCDIKIDDDLLSRVNSTLIYKENEWYLYDGNYIKNPESKSTNGTWIYLIDETQIYDNMIFKSNQNLWNCKLIDN